MNIRELKENEVEYIMNLWYKETINCHSFIKKEYWDKVYEVVKKEYISTSETYVYELNGEIIGFVSLIEKEFLGAIFIKYEYQNKGYGKALINFVKENRNKIILRVYEKNKKAVEFYSRNKFIIINMKENIKISEKEYLMLWKN